MMTTNKRNIHISIRQKNYIFLKGIASKKGMTLQDLIKKIALYKFENPAIKESSKDLLKFKIQQLKKTGVLLNTLTKQMNSNIVNRVSLEVTIVDGIIHLIKDLLSDLELMRNSSSSQMNQNLKLLKSENLNKQNNRKLGQNKWCFPRISLSESEYDSIESSAKNDGVKINKYVGEKLLIFLNQSSVDKIEITSMVRSTYNLISNILNNSNQFWNNKKQNARATEVIIAKKLADFLNDKLADLAADPLLYKGRKFSFVHYLKVVNS